MIHSRKMAVGVLACLLPALCGCGMLAAAGGRGDRQALYKIPVGKRVLVFVDVRPELTVPPEFASQLGQKIADHMFKYQAATQFVAQARLTDLRKDTEKFAKYGVADVARETDADIVVHVDVITFDISALSDDSITQGLSQSLVKVIDRSGKRLWPANAATGAAVEARVAPAFTEQRNKAGVQKEIVDLMALRVGRMFHKYSLDDAAMTK